MSDKPISPIAKILAAIADEEGPVSPVTLETYLRAFPRTTHDQANNDMSATRFTEITLRIRYELDGEPIEVIQDVECRFLAPDRILLTSSSFMLDDYRLLFGDEAVVTPLESGDYELVGVVHPSKMRHFKSEGGRGEFPTAELHKVGGEWESELMLWLTHIPADQFENFCASTGRSFLLNTETFSGSAGIESSP